MKFLSDILAKAGLTVDGVVTLNNTATGQTPDANDNSTKLATTAWVRTFVQPYSLPIATASILGGIKVGEGLSINASTGVLSTVGGASITSFRSEYIITATAGQTTFTVPNGYTPGKIDLFLNGVYLNDTIYTATNSSTIVLDDAAALDDILTVFVYSTYYVGDSPSARTTTYFTATSNQTVFTVAYVIGQVDIFYNGSKLEPSEYTANNGTSITLLTPATTSDKIEVVNWAVGGGIASTRTITINGVTYDLSANRTWTLTTANISEVTNLYYTDARARAAISESVTGLDYNSATGVFSTTTGYGIPTTSSQTNWDAAYNDKINSAAVTGTTTKTLTLTQQDGGTITASWTDDNTDAVTSIFGRTGVVVATSGDYTTTLVTEGTNLYYTDVRSRTAISLTTTGTSGAATYDNTTGVINIPQYQGGVTSFNTRTGAITLSSSDVTTALTYTPVTNARTLTINGTTYDLTADRSWSIASGVTSFNTRTGAISLTSLDVTDALTYTPVTNARTLTINGTSYDLSANRSWTIAPDVSVRNTYAFTATAAQTTFTVSGGYTVGLVDVFINGVKLAAADFTATNGTTVVLGTGTGVGNIVEIIKYVSAFTTAVETTRTLTINGTTYDLSANRTWSIDNASLGAQPQLNGTGFVKISGTTISYDNSTYLTTASAASTYVPYTGATGNVALGSYNLSLTNLAVNSIGANNNGLNDIGALGGNTFRNVYANSFVRTNGTSSQFLKADGSVDSSTYLTTSSASSTYLPLSGGTLTGALGGTTASFSSTITSSSTINAGDSVTLLGELYWGGTSSGQKTRAYTTGSSGSATLNYSFWTGSAWFIRATLDSNGAATFISSVTAGGDVNIPNGNYYYAKRNTGSANINILGIASGTDTTTLKGGTSGATTSIIFADTGGDIARFFNGNLLIGTNTNNSRKLQVAGSGALFTSGDTSGASFNIVPDAIGQNGVDLNISYFTGTGFGPLTFTLGGLERLRITSDGYLGTTVTSSTVSSGDLLGVLSFVSKDSSTYSSGGITNIRSYATSTYNTGNVAGDLRFYVSNGLQNTTASYLFGTEAMRINSDGVVRIINLTSNGLIGTDSSGNLRTVVSEYTEIATGTITYLNNSGSPWGINNSFPATIRNYEDEGMAGSAGVATSLNLGRGVTFDLGSAKAVRRIVERGYPTKNLNVIIAQYSTDNSTWTDICVYNHIYSNTQKIMEFNPTGAISARYWRWFIHSWTEREVTNYYTYENIIYT